MNDDDALVTPERLSAQRIEFVNVVATALFTATAIAAAVIFTRPWQWLAAICALVCFAIGVFAFIWSYFHALGRSRTETIGVAQLYLLTGDPTPAPVRRKMLALLAVQVIVAIATASARLEDTDGSPGTSLALGALVPMLGFGLNGMWVAFHGRFPPRERSIGQNGDHG